VFNNCTIKSLANSFITAAGTTVNQEFGYVFFDCKLIADQEVKKVYLGRPWRPYAKTVYIRTDMDGHINAQGWDPWKGDKMFPDKERTALYAEYQSQGEGANANKRVAWSKQFSKKEIKKYTLKNIFSGSKAWIPEL
jgi:pectinesterase